MTEFHGQLPLTMYERRRLPLGNQYTDRRFKPVMCWRVVKAAAFWYEVEDWTSKVDPELTYEENVDLMRRKSTRPSRGGSTIRDMPASIQEARPKNR